MANLRSVNVLRHVNFLSDQGRGPGGRCWTIFRTFLRSRIDSRLSGCSLFFFANTLISEAKTSFWTVRIISAVVWVGTSKGGSGFASKGTSGFPFLSLPWLRCVTRESSCFTLSCFEDPNPNPIPHSSILQE